MKFVISILFIIFTVLTVCFGTPDNNTLKNIANESCGFTSLSEANRKHTTVVGYNTISMPYKDPQKRREYQEQYRIKNKERLTLAGREYYRNNSVKIKIEKKKYRENNKEKIYDRYKRWRAKNWNKALAHSRKWNRNNKEKRAETSKLYEEKNKIKISKRKAEYYLGNRERVLKRQADYRKNNREKIQESGREYYANNKDKYKEYQTENRKKINKHFSERRKVDERYRIKKNLSSRMSFVVKRNKGIKASKFETLIGCSIQELRDYLESKFQDGMSWDNYRKDGWHIDHITPCDAFDLINPEEQKKCFHYTNLQPLWRLDNSRKSNKILK